MRILYIRQKGSEPELDKSYVTGRGWKFKNGNLQVSMPTSGTYSINSCYIGLTIKKDTLSICKLTRVSSPSSISLSFFANRTNLECHFMVVFRWHIFYLSTIPKTGR